MSFISPTIDNPNAKKLTLVVVLSIASLGILWRNYAGRVHTIPSIFPLITGGKTDALQTALSRDRSSTGELDPDGNTALHIAAVIGNVDMVQIVLSNGGNPNAFNGRGETPLQSAISSPRNSQKIVKLLLGAGADPKLKLIGSDSILHVAARTVSVDPRAVALLIKEPAQLNLRDDAGKTPLEIAHDYNNLRFLSAVDQLARN